MRGRYMFKTNSNEEKEYNMCNKTKGNREKAKKRQKEEWWADAIGYNQTHSN